LLISALVLINEAALYQAWLEPGWATRKPPWYATTTYVTSVFHPSTVVKSSTCLAGLKVGCVHLCRVECHAV